MRHAAKTLVLAGALVAFASTPAVAQAAGDDRSADVIVVTAQKREQNLQDVPISLTAISSDTIDRSGLASFFDLQHYAPNVVMTQRGDARVGAISIRGVESSQDNPGKQSSIGVFVDGVFMARVGMGTNDLLDIERVEVLRGPQGTLFGMNTAGGLVHIITRKPNLEGFEAYGEFVAGNFGALEERARVSGPLIKDTLGFSLSGYHVDRDGVIENTTLGRDVDDRNRSGLRGKLYYVSDGFDLTLIGDYNRERSACCVNVFTTVTAPGAVFGLIPIADLLPPNFPESRIAVTDAPNTNDHDGRGVTAEANWRGAWGTLTSITSWRDWDISVLNDVDSLPLNIADNFFIEQHHEQASQEVRFASPPGRRLEYLAGLFIFRRESDDFQRIAFQGPAAVFGFPGTDGATVIDSNIVDTSYAAFASFTGHPVEPLAVTAGLRYTRELQDASLTQTSNNIAFPNLNGHTDRRDEGELTFTINAVYDWTPNLMTYAAVARGFKPGGFDLTRLPNFDNFQFEEETNLNYEIGVKTQWVDNRLTVNGALFRTDYSDFQTTSFNGLDLITDNAPGFVTQGVELEATGELSRQLSVQTALSYTDAHYTDFKNGSCTPDLAPPCDLTGRRLQQAPRWTLNASADYRTKLSQSGWEAFARAEYSYKSRIFFAQNLDPNLSQGAVGLVNARAGVESGSGVRLELWARNLLDKDYQDFAFAAPFIDGGYVGFLGEPRTFGGRVSVSY